MRRVPALAALAVAGVVGLAACSGGSSTKTASPSTTPTTAAPAADQGSTATSAAATTKANANTGTAAQITAALDAAGVPNAARWTREVEEYRPYPSNDPNLSKLRQNLAKYNPGEDTVNKIVSALTP